jgi:phospholipase/carboxylesterase
MSAWPTQPRDPRDPHAGQPTLTAGPATEQAGGALVLLHGRGATAESILALYSQLRLPQLAAFAPQAAGYSWYPESFLAPLNANQPYLDSALARVEALLSALLVSGMESDRIALLGFSQGACLVLEYSARHPRRYGALMGLTGGLIGPRGTPRDYSGSLGGTPVFLGAGDPDPHVPFERVQETQRVLDRMGAHVELRRYPRMPHTINEDELDACRAFLQTMLSVTERSQL